MGVYMLLAFILGFWCIWSANRDVNSLMESLVFIIIAIIVKALMEWSGVPSFDNVLMAQWGILYLFCVAVLEAVQRFSRSMGINMGLALAGAFGWFFLAQYVFSEAGTEWVTGLVQ